MSSPQEIVESFYKSNAWKDLDKLAEFLHPDYEQYWHSQNGLTFYDYTNMLKHGQELQDHFANVEFKISHVVSQGNQVVLRYAVYAATHQSPQTLNLHAHFIALWEVKEGRLFRCYEISAPADVAAVNEERQ